MQRGVVYCSVLQDGTTYCSAACAEPHDLSLSFAHAALCMSERTDTCHDTRIIQGDVLDSNSNLHSDKTEHKRKGIISKNPWSSAFEKTAKLRGAQQRFTVLGD